MRMPASTLAILAFLLDDELVARGVAKPLAWGTPPRSAATQRGAGDIVTVAGMCGAVRPPSFYSPYARPASGIYPRFVGRAPYFRKARGLVGSVHQGRVSERWGIRPIKLGQMGDA